MAVIKFLRKVTVEMVIRQTTSVFANNAKQAIQFFFLLSQDGVRLSRTGVKSAFTITWDIPHSQAL